MYVCMIVVFHVSFKCVTQVRCLQGKKQTAIFEIFEYSNTRHVDASAPSVSLSALQVLIIQERCANFCFVIYSCDQMIFP